MLPRAHRMTTSRQFAEAISGGRRAGASTVVVYALAGRAGWNDSAGSGGPAGSDRTGAGRTESDDSAATSVGFVVSKGVGNSVVRHRVLRQLRALIAQRMPALEFQRSVVVRALPAAAGKPSSVLAADLDRALGKALRPRAGARS